jgi:N-acetylmuramoyl-L-alanine amidase
MYDAEPVPEIVDSPRSQRKIIAPAIVKPARTKQKNIYKNIPREWLPPSRVEKKWAAVVVHHSGTESGNAAIFDKWHREGRHWDGVGYDFVVGNGTDSGDGEVEVTFRWREQIPGAHTGGTPGNWANRDAVGICVVGNFNNTTPTTRQMQSLAGLIGFLQRRYRIPNSRIYGHRTTPGARSTDCPGRNFPMDRLRAMVSDRADTALAAGGSGG